MPILRSIKVSQGLNKPRTQISKRIAHQTFTSLLNEKDITYIIRRSNYLLWLHTGRSYLVGARGLLLWRTSFYNDAVKDPISVR